jgi:hypothetical protein
MAGTSRECKSVAVVSRSCLVLSEVMKGGIVDAGTDDEGKLQVGKGRESRGEREGQEKVAVADAVKGRCSRYKMAQD